MKKFCVDLELAKALKEGGFLQNSEFSWVMVGKGEAGLQMDVRITTNNPLYVEISAPISDEILKELPKEIKDINFTYFYHLKIERSLIHNERYFVSYGITSPTHAWMEQYQTNGNKLSNALAKMYLRLTKEGYIK